MSYFCRKFPRKLQLFHEGGVVRSFVFFLDVPSTSASRGAGGAAEGRGPRGWVSLLLRVGEAQLLRSATLYITM